MEGLGEVGVGAAFKPKLFSFLLGSCGKHHDGNLGVAGVVFEEAADLVPIHLGKHEIKQDEVGFFGLRFLEAFLAVVGRQDLVTLGIEPGLKHLNQIQFIVDDEDSLFSHSESQKRGQV